MAPIIGALLPTVVELVGRLFPDPKAADEAKLRLMEMARQGELAQLEADVKLAAGQLAVNQAEAANSNWFVSSWRPFIGWTCGMAFAFKFVGGPILVLICSYYGHQVTLPEFDYSEMSTILLGMLGLGGMRSLEKIKGAAK